MNTKSIAGIVFVSCLGFSPGCIFDDSDPDDGYPADVLDALDLPEMPYDYAGIELPAHFQSDVVRSYDNTPADNPITNHGATLGRVLFYDTELSANGTIACASCHRQDAGFSDPATFSVGFEGGLTGRNSMGLANLRYYRNGRMFWDERASTIEEQALMPIQDPVEMGMTLELLVERVAEQPYYGYLFEQAFGDREVTSDRIARAMAQFIRSIVSYRSRFDEGIAMTGNFADPFANFTAEENEGKNIFMTERGGCFTCHVDNPPSTPGQAPPNQAIFFVDRAVVNGVDSGTDVPDNGIGDLTENPADDGRFKSPSLRNIALTAPYMHDGRHTDLEAVVDFYSFGVQTHPNLDPRLSLPGSNEPRRLNLNNAEIQALIAFLDTLTDYELTRDPKYSDPFRDTP